MSLPYSAGLLASVTLATLLAGVDAGVVVDTRVAGISGALARSTTGQSPSPTSYCFISLNHRSWFWRVRILTARRGWDLIAVLDMISKAACLILSIIVSTNLFTSLPIL